ncbi:MAG: DUF1194 domain-containing protein [Silicimonas sp.]|nr:DUF1194 domain-containing protein [Silicimonas sp.]NND19948.1 DUF1194 domain-containing protein [Silicimonas sp.]
MRTHLWSLLVLMLVPASRAAATEVDMQLVLAVDISRSMSHVDLATQRRGYAEALTSDEVLAAVSRGMLGRIGVTYVEWSDVERQRVIVDWTLIESPDDASGVAQRIIRETGGTMRMTSISTGLAFAAGRFRDSPFTSWRRVIDISGDGPNNDGLPVLAARDRVTAEGITINGLPVMAGGRDVIWHLPDLDLYYRDCVIGGPGAFVLPVRGWENFGDAIRRKLVLEIADTRPAAPPERLHRASAYDCLIGEKILNRMRQRDN